MKVSVRECSPMAAVMLVACFATAGCSDAVAPPAVVPQPSVPASAASSPPSLVGTVPDDTSKETPSTTSVTKSDMSKAQQSRDMPMPGQANDHSTLRPKATPMPNSPRRE